MRAAHAALPGASLHGASGEDTGMSCPPTCRFSFSQLAAVGHDGSDGRTRRMGALAKAARIDVGRYRQIEEKSGIAARRLMKLLLFISGNALDPKPLCFRSKIATSGSL